MIKVMGWQNKNLDNRRIFVNTLNKLSEKDNRIIVLIPDVGFNYLDDPDLKFKVINTGITEEFTIIMAAAMALDGWKPYVYSMINFVTFRPMEMVRNAISLHGANVKLIGVKGSEAYKMLGFSHNMIMEDEDIYHIKPYIDCEIPEINEVERLIIETYKSKKACYIRL